MNKTFKLLLILFIAISQAYASGKLTVSVGLSPAGSFEITSSKVKGKAVKAGGGYVAKKISVKTNSLVTGLELRDRHLHDKLEVSKFKKITILDGKAKGGKGVATIEVKNIKKKVGFSYKESGGNLVVSFSLSLKDFNFSGINYAGVGVKDKVDVKAIIPVK